MKTYQITKWNSLYLIIYKKGVVFWGFFCSICEDCIKPVKKVVNGIIIGYY